MTRDQKGARPVVELVAVAFLSLVNIGHKYVGHNYIGHNYTGHDYITPAVELVAVAFVSLPLHVPVRLCAYMLIHIT